jgi:DNA polymerase-3 subunit delta'
MLTGPDAAGIEAFAVTLAQAMLCEAGGAEACGQCHNCGLFVAGSHPDYFHIQPNDKGTIKIDSLRDISQRLTQKAARGGFQVVFIERADCMQTAGANAILKTLEEPEGDVLFILWAKRVESLPATIRSRTQQLNCASGSQQAMQAWLSDELQLDAQKPWLKVASDRPLAVKGLQEDNYFDARDELIDTLQAVKEKRRSALDAAESFSDWDRTIYFQALLSIAADGLRHCLGVAHGHWVNEDKASAIERLFAKLEAEQAQDFYDVVQRLWRYEQLPQALNKSLLDCQAWLEWEKLAEVYYAH